MGGIWGIFIILVICWCSMQYIVVYSSILWTNSPFNLVLPCFPGLPSPPYLQQWPDLMRPTEPQLLSSNGLTLFWNHHPRGFFLLPSSHISCLLSCPCLFGFHYSFNRFRCFSFPLFSPFLGGRIFTAHFYPLFAVFSCFWRGVFGLFECFPT